MHLHSPASFFSSLGTQNLSKKNLKTNSSPCLRLKHQSEFYSNFYSNQGRLKSLLILETYSVPVKFTTMALIKFLLEFMLRFWLVHWSDSHQMKRLLKFLLKFESKHRYLLWKLINRRKFMTWAQQIHFWTIKIILTSCELGLSALSLVTYERTNTHPNIHICTKQIHITTYTYKKKYKYGSVEVMKKENREKL